MPSARKRSNFFDSEEGLKARERLSALVESSDYITDDGFSSDAEQYPDGVMPFVDKHMEYLRTHPQIQIDHYIANLRLRTRSR